MGLLIDGVWQEDVSRTKDGQFIRPATSFRNFVTADGSAGPTGEGGFPAEAGRYKLKGTILLAADYEKHPVLPAAPPAKGPVKTAPKPAVPGKQPEKREPGHKPNILGDRKKV